MTILGRIAGGDAARLRWRLESALGARLIFLVLALLAYNNLAFWWAAGDTGRRLLVDGANGLVWGCLLLWSARVEDLAPQQLGWTRANLGRSLGWGLMAGVAMAAPALLFFAFPLIIPQPVRYAGYASLDAAGLLLILFPRLLVTHALLEETLFRGLVQARAIGWLGVARGMALTCALFVFWHVVVVYQAVEGTNLTASPLPAWLLSALAAVPLGAAGAIFSFLRLATGTLLSPILAHWVVNSLILLFLFLGSS